MSNLSLKRRLGCTIKKRRHGGGGRQDGINSFSEKKVVKSTKVKSCRTSGGNSIP